ncbi:MAG TPA: prepilin-type N-terminal cleavage/methylation domain-containing protein [Opitutaceae bacterium]|jgi:prepilin-type N-terminal cleavage/methylation domain-containing protein|nr:prepilin-type N-terminal cleavage/methylation domain-containing protein [Opitutaceae bacterium]
MKTPRFLSLRAFTLTEVLIAMTIVGFVMAGVMTFYITTVQQYYFSEQKLLINANTRNFTETMMASARDSNFVVLYKSFYVPYTTANNTFPYTGNDGTTNWPGSSAAGGDSTTTTTFKDGGTTLDAADRLSTADAGDYIIFVTYNDPFYTGSPTNYTPSLTTAASNPTVSRIVAFWVAPNRLYNGTNGQPAQMALYSFDSNNFPGGTAPYLNNAGAAVVFPNTAGNTVTTTLLTPNDLENMLPANTLAAATNAAYAKIVVNDLRGQTSLNGNPSQGYNFKFLAANQTPGQANTVISSTSVLVNSMILDGTSAKHVTNTYNFTINPNG